MNFLDLIILLPIAYVAYRGFVNGFIREAFGIMGIILAVYITFKYMGTVSGIVVPYVENRDRATIVTGIVLFIGVIVTVQFIGIALEKFFEAAHLGIINQLSGMVFGALKMTIFISVILLLLAGVGIPSEETTANSASYPYVISVGPATFDLVASMIPGTEDFIHTIERTIQESNSIRDLPIFEKLDPSDS
ncbi:CvpA family protein [Rhodohalobacter sp. 614A]|uniref:CvpA family protein n=1 Tax=Rhodohalobacter sp. 614A TaxID=2908649 RepID=UPI001F40E0A2|nr:CvpA family protein [Rhodohalobacter sp. 614A]